MKTFLTAITIVSAVAMASAQHAREQHPADHNSRDRHTAPAQGEHHPVGQLQVRVATAPVEQQVVKGAPYSAEVETESVQTLADGNRIVRRTTGRVYRDSEGRVRREEDEGPEHHATITIFDPVADVNYTLDQVTRTASKSTTFMTLNVFRTIEKLSAEAGARGGHGGGFSASGGPATARGRTMKNGVRAETLSSTMMEGVRAQGTRRTETIAANTIGNELPITVVSEEWTSPELQVLVMTKHSDPRVGDSTYRLRNINRSEPYASLFQVPADYTIKESEFRRK